MKLRNWEIRKFIPGLSLLLLFFLVFKSWFSFQSVAARDWIFLYPQNLKELPKIPTFWDNQGSGMGNVRPYNWFFFYFSWSAKFLNFLGLSWPVIEKIVWFWPYLLLSIFSSTFLFRTLFPKNKFWIFAPFLFLFNTFSLIITGGGQIIFAMAYALAPLVIALFINLLTSSRVHELTPNQNTAYQNTINQNKFGTWQEFDTRQEFGSGQADSKINPVNFTEVKNGAGGLRRYEKKNGSMVRWLDGWRKQNGWMVDGLKSSRRAILAGVVLGVQAMFDPRVAYITMMAVGIYWIISLLTSSRVQELKGSRVKRLLLSLFIAVGLNLFWLLPVILTRGPVLPETYGETGWVNFLSFARFSDALSLLHPFWPENIFGKTYFFRPEFLILPILAFSSLLFISYSRVNELTSLKNKKITNSLITNSLINNEAILYFALLSLLGAFLAKGSNPPFGEVYLWLFKNVPGMNMFRDPVKFYVLIAIGYSVLIPFSISRSYEWLRKRFGY